MSNAVTSICRPLRLSPAQKAVLMCLADFCHDNGEDWHSIAALMAWTCLGKTAVIDALKWLEAAGLLIREHAGNGRKSTTRLVLTAIESAAANQSATQTGTPAEPVRPANPTGTPAEPEPVRLPDQPVRLPDPKHQEASVKHQESINTRAAGDGDRRFAAFWSAYPRKVGKDKAILAFAKLRIDDDLLATMLAAIEVQASTDQWRKDGGQFIPHPATWLNGKRWLDELPAGSGQSGSRPTWARAAGFANRFEAENAGCFEHNAGAFRAGKKLEALA